MLIKLDDELDSLEMYIKMELLRTNRPFQYEVNIAEDIDKYTQYIPAMVIQPFIENAIWHGISDMEEGHISLNVSSDGGYLQIEIQDNGRGFSKMNKGSLKHKSKGTSLVIDRLSMMSAYYSKLFDCKVQSLDEGIKGTLVTLKSPKDLI